MLSAKVIRKAVKDYPALLNKVNSMFLPAAGALVAGQAKRLAPVDRGELRGSIGYQTDIDSVTVGTNVDYAIGIEYGTQPHYPNIGNLKGWARRVLGDESAAYAVAKKIERKGTKAQPFMRPALDANRKNLVRIWETYFGRVYGK